MMRQASASRVPNKAESEQDHFIPKLSQADVINRIPEENIKDVRLCTF